MLLDYTARFNNLASVNLFDYFCQKTGRVPTTRVDVRFEVRFMVGCKKGINYAITSGKWPAGSTITIYNPPVEFSSTLAPYDLAGNYASRDLPSVTGPYKGVIMGRGADGDCGARENGGCNVWRNWNPLYACDSKEQQIELCANGCSGTAGDAIVLEVGCGLSMVTIENEGVIAGGGASFLGGGAIDGNAGGGGFPGGKGSRGSNRAAYGAGYSCWDFVNADWRGGYQGARAWNRAYNTTAGFAGGAGNYNSGGGGAPGYALRSNGNPYNWRTGSSPAGRPYNPPVGGGNGRNDPFSATVLRNGIRA